MLVNRFFALCRRVLAKGVTRFNELIADNVAEVGKVVETFHEHVHWAHCFLRFRCWGLAGSCVDGGGDSVRYIWMRMFMTFSEGCGIE